MTAIWLATALLAFGCFAFFSYMLWKVRKVQHYNYVTALMAVICLAFSANAASRALSGRPEPFEFTLVFLLLVLAFIQLRDEVTSHAIH